MVMVRVLQCQQFMRPCGAVVFAPRICMTAAVATVSPGSFLTLHYRLSGPAGVVVSTFEGSPATLTMGMGELSPTLEACLMGLAEGAAQTFELPAGQAFGERSADMVQWMAKKELKDMGEAGESYAVGDVLHFPTPDGLGKFAGQILAFRSDARGEAVQLDFNHPLAGHPVRFEVQLIGVL
jgi:FKBP-type peptidyl-prolyl cis-trans isomerase SlpA